MKIDVDEISPVQRKVRVELPAETVTSGFSRAYEELRRRVRIKGFRAGKAPRGVLQGMYGDELKDQVQSQLVEDSLGEVIKSGGCRLFPDQRLKPMILSKVVLFLTRLFSRSSRRLKSKTIWVSKSRKSNCPLPMIRWMRRFGDFKRVMRAWSRLKIALSSSRGTLSL